MAHDGVEVPIEKAERAGPFDVHLALRVKQPKDVDRAVRFAGSVCGWEFQLDEQGRRRSGRFEARFGEERARIARASSGGERPLGAESASQPR